MLLGRPGLCWLRRRGGAVYRFALGRAYRALNRKAAAEAMFRACLARDPARSVVCPLSPLGLVEMTRKRTRESLGHILCEPCPACEGRGYLKTVETVCYEIFREVQRSARQFEAQAFLVLAAVPVIERLRDDLSVGLAELEEQLSRPVRLQPEPQYLQESFDVVPI